MAKQRPGQVRDAILSFMRGRKGDSTVDEIHASVEKQLGGSVARSSVRSYLGLNEGKLFSRVSRGRYRLRG